jgi:dTDP-4-dehydrorhamnose 3,5-epimerase
MVMSIVTERTPIEGVLLVRRQVFADQRGAFEEVWRETDCAALGVARFVQDNHSHSGRGVLRGMHFQLRKPQVKLVSVISGVIHDMVLDVRHGSPTFGKSLGFRLEGRSGVQLLAPAGIAHGFCVLSDFAEVVYKCSDYYDAEDDKGIVWNDSSVEMDWPVSNPITSAKDARLPRLSELKPSDLPVWTGGNRT